MMKTLYFDFSMGAAGDMLTAALLELMPDRDAALAEINSLGIPGVETTAVTVNKCGINGTHVSVKINGQEEDEHIHDHEGHTHDHEGYSHEHSGHEHNSLHGIEHIVNEHLSVPDKVKNDILAVYGIIAEAESLVHGMPVDEIHFHEVGTMDAVADVAAVCYLMDKISPDQVIASPVNVGSGTVKCAHGILPVPAPATANILKDIPMYSSEIRGELCTPTGAALLKYFVNSFSDMPAVKAAAIGYGMGKKDFERANCVRAILGETGDSRSVICELSLNVDDVTAEEIGHVLELALEEGAVEAYTIPIGMKKSRPGTMICVMCREADREKMISLLFRHTTTLGVRESISRRYTLDRKIETVETQFGPVRKKVSEGYGVTREKFEYDDVAKIARENDMSIREVREKIK